ncbi:hypothetical protein LCGC14_1302740 [marine sediment metagenome]|uniref:Uncharacterized protein n=1 Tax=marine sediment metagenome TaxID=412755 RepID=A0A0F9L9P5_9ZZZZ
MEKVEAYYSRRLKGWIVRIEEQIHGPTKEEAEQNAKETLKIYREAKLKALACKII